MTLPKNVADAYPLSPMQRLMLLHAISSPASSVLLNQVGYDIRGALDVQAFERAWDTLVGRHPALRTVFLWEGLPQPLQVVRAEVTLKFRHCDLSNLSADAYPNALAAVRREDVEAPMVLGKAPLMRCTLVRLAPDHHYFVWTIHHLVVDRWSHAVLFADLRAMYAAYVRGEAPTLERAAPVRDYIEWIARQDRTAAERFWREELEGAKEPTLLAEVDTSATGGAGGARLTTRRPLSPAATAAMRVRATAWRTTPGALLLSAVALLVAARTGRDDVLYGVTVSGRTPELANAERIVGCFVNNLPARVTLPRRQAVADWVRDVQRAQARRQQYAHVSLADIHSWSSIAPADPLFDTLVLLNLTDESDQPWPGIELVADVATLDAGYPLLLSITTEREELVLTLVHDVALEAPGHLLFELEGVIDRLVRAEAQTRVAELLPAPVAESRTSVPSAPNVPRHAAAPPANGESSVAAALLHAWRDVLGSETIGVDDDFFALGGTSLQAAQLFTRVEHITGKTLPLSTLVGAGSVRGILAAINRPIPRSGTLVRIRSSGTRAPVYAIPGVGGNIVSLPGLARALGADYPFYAFESPGLDGNEPPLTSIDAISERYVREIMREPEGPFHIFGLCWGATVVAEMTRKLTALGHPPASLTLINPTALARQTATGHGRPDTDFIRQRLEIYWDEFREGDWRDRTRLIADKAKRAARLLAGGEASAASMGELHRFRVEEANKTAALQYVPSPLDARARLFITPYRGEGEDPRLEWLELIRPRPDVIPVNGVNAGDAISAVNVREFAEVFRAWLHATADVAAPAPSGDTG